MSSGSEEFIDEPDYIHALAAACQRFVAAISIVEPGAFITGVRSLTDDVPVADTMARAMVMWTALSGVATRGAGAHHDLFHRCFGGSCGFRSPWLQSLDTLSAGVVRLRVTQWAEVYAREFDVAHQWPSAVRAAALLRRQPGAVWHVSELADAVGASCSTLERSFGLIYGTTPRRYNALVRLRHTMETLRNDDGSLEGVILGAGWGSVKDAHRSIRKSTGMTLSGVRKLREAEFESLMAGSLALPLPR
jgi:AraC-like DNA-binding protein